MFTALGIGNIVVSWFVSDLFEYPSRGFRNQALGVKHVNMIRSYTPAVFYTAVTALIIDCLCSCGVAEYG